MWLWSPQARTLAVIPAMLAGAQHIEELIEALEVRFLANRDPLLHFGLLTDFLDADEATLPTDVRLAGSGRIPSEHGRMNSSDPARREASGLESRLEAVGEPPEGWTPTRTPHGAPIPE